LQYVFYTIPRIYSNCSQIINNFKNICLQSWLPKLPQLNLGYLKDRPRCHVNWSDFWRFCGGDWVVRVRCRCCG